MGFSWNHHSNGGVDKTVGVPAAQFGLQQAPPLTPPSPEELCAIYYAQIKDLKANLAQHKDMLQVASDAALGLLKMLVDRGYAFSAENAITIPLGVHFHMDGSTIEVGRNDSGDIIVRLIERTDA